MASSLKLTKAQLAAQLERAHVQYQTLLTAFDTLALDHAALVAKAAKPAASISPARAAFLARSAERRVDPSALAFKSRCEQARTHALQSGRSVKV